MPHVTCCISTLIDSLDLCQVLCERLVEEPSEYAAVWADIVQRRLPLVDATFEALFQACAASGDGLAAGISILREAKRLDLMTRQATVLSAHQCRLVPPVPTSEVGMPWLELPRTRISRTSLCISRASRENLLEVSRISHGYLVGISQMHAAALISLIKWCKEDKQAYSNEVRGQLTL